jgi:hypothetical protein
MSSVVESSTVRQVQLVVLYDHQVQKHYKGKLVESDDALCLPIHCTKVVAAEIDTATVTSLCNVCDVGLEHIVDVSL